MTKSRGELKAEAKEALSGKKISSLIFLLFCFAAVQLVNYIVSYFSLATHIHGIVTACLCVLLGFPFLTAVFKYFLVLSRGEKKKLSEIFSVFDRSYMTAVYFAFTLFAAAYISDFAASLGFEQSSVKNAVATVRWLVYLALYVYGVFGMFVIADNPDGGFKEVFAKTNACIKKNFIRLLVLTLSFAGWFLVGVLTAGVGFLWIIPYFIVTCARLYESTREKEEYIAPFEEQEEEEPEEASDSDVTKDLSPKKEEKKEPSPDETVVFTKEMLEKIKNSGKID